MEPRIIERNELTVVGMVYYGNPFHAEGVTPEENEVGKLWTRFNTYWDAHREAFKHEVDADIAWELHVVGDEYEQTKEYAVMVGVEVSAIEDPPDPIFCKVLPAGQYAVFTLRGEEMNGNWGRTIYNEWLPASGYEESSSCTLERYDEKRFKAWGGPESEVEIWVPIKARE
jgi:AraC family transcriptional regulator